MPSSYTIGKHFEDFISDQLATGRYASASEGVRDGLRLLEDRERRKADFDRVIAESLADVAAGRLHDAEDVFEEILAEVKALPPARNG